MVWQDSADDGTDGGMLNVDLPAGATNPVVAVEEAADFLTGVIVMLRQTVVTGCLDAAAGRIQTATAEIDSFVGWRQTLTSAAGDGTCGNAYYCSRSGAASWNDICRV